VTLAEGESEDLPVTQSDHALILRGAGELGLPQGTYRFGSGTRIEGGMLQLGSTTILHSNVRVEHPGRLSVWGTVQGDIENHGTVRLVGLITGDLHNAGRFALDAVIYGDPMRIGGDFTQSADGVLAFSLVSSADWMSEYVVPLRIDGRANLDGLLELHRYTDGWGPYALPDARAHHLIHADGGVFGRFAQWTSPGLAITGELRYEANDVWFDLARISLQEAIAARGVAGALPLASAANLDRALAIADGFALAPAASLGEAQRQFLASAASIMWQQDTAQAVRSFDSLAGHAHAGMGDTLHRQAALASARLDARLARQDHATGAMSWSGRFQPDAGAHGFAGLSSGIDRWLSPRLLVGGSVSSGQASLHFHSLGGHGWGEAPAAGLHLHYRGEGWHATAALGAGRARLQLQRPIELGAAGRHLAHSQRGFGHAFAHAELGRDLALGDGRLLPFVALDYGIVRSDGFAEQGDTGLELVAGPSRQARLTGALGARYAHDWSLGRRQLRLALDARYRHDLAEGDPLRAAFRGVPDAWFDLPGEQGRGAGELRLGLAGVFGGHLHWSMDYARGFAGERRDDGWHFALGHAF